MKFPYKKIPILLDPKTRRIGTTHRPIIPVEIAYKGESRRYEALIDSGADHCIFHAEIAELLNIRLEDGKKYVFGGIGGSGLVGYIHPATLTIGGHSFDTEVVFSFDISQSGYGILGQTGFFDHFRIRFIYAKKLVEVTREMRT